jgi:hypothetical protein
MTMQEFVVGVSRSSRSVCTRSERRSNGQQGAKQKDLAGPERCHAKTSDNEQCGELMLQTNRDPPKNQPKHGAC